MKRYYVYELIDPRDGLPFYVGKGRGNRMYSHVAEAKRGKYQWSNLIKCERINSITSKGLSVGYNVVGKELNESNALIIEQQLIDTQGLLIDGTGRLTNIRKNNQHHSTVPGRKYKSKEVCQYTLSGKIENYFSSVTAAADFMCKYKTSILNCCNGKRHTAYGYVWNFVGDEFVAPPTQVNYHINRRRPVQQIDNTGIIVTEFVSIKEAGEITGIDRGNICWCCNGKLQTAGGFKWKFI